MSQPQNDEKQSQTGYSGRGNVTQVGRDYSNTANVNLLIPLFFISIFALGGLAWALAVGVISGQQNPQAVPEQSPSISTPTISPSSSN